MTLKKCSFGIDYDCHTFIKYYAYSLDNTQSLRNIYLSRTMKWPQMSLDATKWHLKFQKNFFWGETPQTPHKRGDTPLSYSPPSSAHHRRACWPSASLVKVLYFQPGENTAYDTDMRDIT